MAELRCKVCGSTLILRNSKAGAKFLACPKSYKGNNHGTYGTGQWMTAGGKYYELPTYRQGGCSQGTISGSWLAHVRDTWEIEDPYRSPGEQYESFWGNQDY